MFYFSNGNTIHNLSLEELTKLRNEINDEIEDRRQNDLWQNVVDAIEEYTERYGGIDIINHGVFPPKHVGFLFPDDFENETKTLHLTIGKESDGCHNGCEFSS